MNAWYIPLNFWMVNLKNINYWLMFKMIKLWMDDNRDLENQRSLMMPISKISAILNSIFCSKDSTQMLIGDKLAIIINLAIRLHHLHLSWDMGLGITGRRVVM